MTTSEVRLLKRRANRIKFALAREFDLWMNGECPSNQFVAQECAKRMGATKPVSRKHAPFVLVEYWQKFHGSEPVQSKSPATQTAEKSRRKRRDFYASPEWKRIRYKALVLCGARCQCCGTTAESSGRPLHVDHVKPRHHYPELELEITNLQVLCEDCNLGKGAWDETDWRVQAAQHMRDLRVPLPADRAGSTAPASSQTPPERLQ